MAQRNGNTLMLKTAQDNTECALKIDFQGSTADIVEESCSALHGQSCGFSGTLQRVSGGKQRLLGNAGSGGLPRTLHGAYKCGGNSGTYPEAMQVVAYHDDGTYVDSMYMTPNSGAEPVLTGARTGRWRLSGTQLDRNQTGFINPSAETDDAAFVHTAVQISDDLVLNADGSYSGRRTQWVVDGKPQQIPNVPPQTCVRQPLADQVQERMRAGLPQRLFQ
jgi:hypothetical protein